MFIRKIQEIILHEDTVTENDFKLKTEISFRNEHRNQKEYDRLKILIETKNISYEKEINMSYHEGKISIYEIGKLLEIK